MSVSFSRWRRKQDARVWATYAFGRFRRRLAVGRPDYGVGGGERGWNGRRGNAEIPLPEIKKLFANNCSWCHGAYGMTADKGPRLAGTKMTEEEVRERIRHGKEGYMPSFAKVLTDPQIAAFAKYIKSLTPAD